MTVAELISKLTAFPADALVLHETQETFSDVVAVESRSHYAPVPEGRYVVITDDWRGYS